MIESDEGKMTYISQEKDIEKLKTSIELLKHQIEEDKKNGDDKSLKYHTLALEEEQKQLETLIQK